MDDDTRALYLCQIARLHAAEDDHFAAIKAIKKVRQELRAEMIAASLVQPAGSVGELVVK